MTKIYTTISNFMSQLYYSLIGWAFKVAARDKRGYKRLVKIAKALRLPLVPAFQRESGISRNVQNRLDISGKNKIWTRNQTT